MTAHPRPGTGSSATGPSAAGPSAAGPSAAGPSAAGPSVAGPSAAGPSAAGPSAAGPSATGPSAAALSEAALLTVCAAPGWAARVAAGRPYGSLDALLDAAERALTDADLDAAMAGHPRIGDRAAGGRSRREQSAVGAAPADVLDALAAGNRAYEERFGHVYLVCASGRSAEDLLATLHTRLGNDPATERAVALAELAAINRIRLTQLVTEDAPHTPRRPA